MFVIRLRALLRRHLVLRQDLDHFFDELRVFLKIRPCPVLGQINLPFRFPFPVAVVTVTLENRPDLLVECGRDRWRPLGLARDPAGNDGEQHELGDHLSPAFGPTFPEGCGMSQKTEMRHLRILFDRESLDPASYKI